MHCLGEWDGDVAKHRLEMELQNRRGSRIMYNWMRRIAGERTLEKVVWRKKVGERRLTREGG